MQWLAVNIRYNGWLLIAASFTMVDEPPVVRNCHGWRLKGVINIAIPVPAVDACFDRPGGYCL